MVLHVGGSNQEIDAWLRTLTSEQMAELVSLDDAWYGADGITDKCIKEINKDWVEEHGGRREWWKHIGATIEGSDVSQWCNRGME